MAQITIRGQTVDADIIAELEQFEWTRARWTSDKLLAASPFRYDKTPSFFVRLEPYGDLPAGVWSDQGAYDDEWRSGNFVKLLSFLRNETYEEAEDYLLELYGNFANNDEIKLRPNLVIQRNRQPLNEMILDKYSAMPNDYLLKRGITADVQRQMGVLDGGNRVVIPWRTPSGKLANVKYRAVSGKLFWYEHGGIPLRELVYGLDVVWKQRESKVVLCEADIDAMSWRVAGYGAVAVGGVAFSEKKLDLIVRSPIEELIIATDNDKAGEKLREEVEKELSMHIRIRQAYIQSECKDANEALVKYGAESLSEAFGKSLYIERCTFALGKR